MVLSAGFGFIVGDGFGESIGRRECIEQTNEDLHDQLEKARSDRKASLHYEPRQQRRVINDIHKRGATLLKPVNQPPAK